MRNLNLPASVVYPPGYHREAPKRSAWIDACIIAVGCILGALAVAYIAHRENVATRCDCYHDAEACEDAGRDPKPCNVAWRLHP